MADFHRKNSNKTPAALADLNAAGRAISFKSAAALAEEKILDFWRENKIFQKSLEKPSPAGNYVFFDGPPFATGLPHYGHILVSAIKDAVPRYQTMRGKRVERRWGWDCHGLPIENIVEKDLKVSGKREIEELGLARFNEYARSKVLDFAAQWKETVERIGRWVDYGGAYMTMDNDFIESVWWALKNIWDKKLIYEGMKVLPYCPRCETPIANSEIAMDGSYKDIADISVYIKLALENEPKTYLIAWTTTPWTLPGNTAAGVNENLDYVTVKVNDERYIIAKNKTSILKDKFEILGTMKGRALVGKRYSPPFDYFTGADFRQISEKEKENAWKVYSAPYVTAETGSGIVHIAPAYGEEDLELALKRGIPLVRHVGSDGRFTSEVADFAGIKVKPKDDHQSADVLIVKNLAARGLLLAKEKIIHSYPHCFRCETPLYYFAIPAWFVKIHEIKKKLVKLNEDIDWVPKHLKHGRFGKSVEGAPDWNISRNRYWASPLPFWKCEKSGHTECVGSLDELKKRAPAKNKYLVMRHGEAERNLTDTVSCSPKDDNKITERGRAEVLATAQKLKKESIDFIYSSDLVRAKQTAEIVARELGISAENTIFAPEIRELNAGAYNGKSWTEYRQSFDSPEARFETASKNGETLFDVRDRVVKFIYDLEKKHAGKKILVISHGDAIFFMETGVKGLAKRELMSAFINKTGLISTGSHRPLDFAPIPHNDNFELDFHRPYIDEITFACECGGEMRRIPEVVDCWFESGSMPFAQNHYPFENKEKFEKNFPGDFVAEYIAQTRTWFYYTHAVSAILFNRAPFRHVLTTGTILAEDGAKMSKSKENFPDPKILFDKYGVDALRFYLLSSPLMKSEDLNFSERGVDEVYKKIILRLRNVVSFHETYKGGAGTFDESAEKLADRNTERFAGGFANKLTGKISDSRSASKHILDKWILGRLNAVIVATTAGMESYTIDSALNKISEFIEDISVWFLRRSRERLKSEIQAERGEALNTFRFTLLELSKIIAPFTPFLAEEIYQTLGEAKESVHLEDWPESKIGTAEETAVLADMAETRRIVSLALEARAKAGIKVRQPLRKLAVKTTALQGKKECLDLILDEINVKEIVFDPQLPEEAVLDAEITEDLREEGSLREFVRFIQELRKKSGLKPGEPSALVVSANSSGQKFIEKFETQIKKSALISKISFWSGADGESLGGEKTEIEGILFDAIVRKK